MQGIYKNDFGVTRGLKSLIFIRGCPKSRSLACGGGRFFEGGKLKFKRVRRIGNLRGRLGILQANIC